MSPAADGAKARRCASGEHQIMVKTYPAVLLMAGHGRRIALVVGLLVAVLALGLFAAGFGPVLLVAGLVAAGVAWAGLRLAAELVEVVAETLLPR